MLINLSNHPVFHTDEAGKIIRDNNGKVIYKWEEKQLKAASIYGEMIDLQFPMISPEWPVEEVEVLSVHYSEICEDLLTKSFDMYNAIHLSGEVIFCFLLAQILLEKGYTCITSTSERIVQEVGGKKIVRFDFCRFREYKLRKI